MSTKINNYNVTVIDDITKTAKNVDVYARTPEEARLDALKSGHIVNIKRKRTFFSSIKLSRSARIEFLDVLSTSLIQEINIIEALTDIEKEYSKSVIHRSVGKVAMSLRKRIESGDDLVDAMSDLGPKVFPDDTIALIIGDSSNGSTGEALKEASIFEREMKDLSKGINIQLIIAILLFAFTAVALLGSLYFFVPRMENLDLFKQFPIETPMADLLTNILIYSMAFVTLLGLLLFLLRTFLKSISPYISDKVTMKIPLFNEIVLNKSCYITFFVISRLLEAGVDLTEALQISIDNTKQGVLKRDLKKAYILWKKGDTNWAENLSILKPTQKTPLRASKSKEHTALVLKELSLRFKRTYQDRVAFIIPIIFGITTAFMVATALALTYKFLIPMLEVMEAMLAR
tara:strand:- start:2222 stop:3427 length:1206 start_codon:yes stop_codon:yes gene_type:complete